MVDGFHFMPDLDEVLIGQPDHDHEQDDHRSKATDGFDDQTQVGHPTAEPSPCRGRDCNHFRLL